jgi:hypothetical protein
MAIDYSTGIYTLQTSGVYNPADLYNYSSAGMNRLNYSRPTFDIGSSRIIVKTGAELQLIPTKDIAGLWAGNPGWNDSTYLHTIDVQSGGILTIGNEFTEDAAFVSTGYKSNSYLLQNQVIRVRSGAIINWQGGGVHLNSMAMALELGCTANIGGKAYLFSTGIEKAGLRIYEADTLIESIGLNNASIVPFVVLTNPPFGGKPINLPTAGTVTGWGTIGLSGDWMIYKGWDLSSDSIDAGMAHWDSRWQVHVASKTGMDTNATGNLLDHPNNKGLAEMRQPIRFSATNGGGAKFYTKATIDANVLQGNSVGSNPDYDSIELSYTITESSGVADSATVETRGGILVGTQHRTVGGPYNINNIKSWRGINGTDTFTWLKVEYGKQPAVLNIKMDEDNVRYFSGNKIEINSLPDLGITETNKATVAAYTGITPVYAGGVLTVTVTTNHTWNEVYDFIKYWESENDDKVSENGDQSFISTSNKISYTGHNLAIVTEVGATVDATGKSITADAGYVINGTFNGVISDLTTFRVPITISPIKAGARLVLRKPNLTYAYDEVLTEDNPVIYYESTVSEVLDVGYFETGKEYYKGSINVTGESPVSLSLNLEDDLGLTVSDPLVVSAYPISVVNSSGIYVATYSGDGDEYNLYDYLQYYMRENPDEFFANGRQLCTSDGSKITFNHLRVFIGAGNSELIEWDSDITFDATCKGRVINFHSSGNSHFKFGSKALINGQFVYNRPTLTFLNRVAAKFVLNDQCIYHNYGTLELVGGTIETYTDIYNYYGEDFLVDSGTIKNLEVDYPRDIYMLGDNTGLIQDLTLDSVQGEEFIVEVFIRIPEIDGIEFLNASIMHRTDQALGFEWKNVYSEYNVNPSDFSLQANGGNYRNPAELVEISNEYPCTRCLPAIQSADKANANKGLFIGNRYANFTLINPSGDGIDDGWMYIYDYNNGHRTNAQGWDFTADEPVMVRTQADGTTGVTKVRTWVYHRYLDEVGQGTFDTGSNRLDRRTKYDIEGDRLQPLVREVVVGGYGYVTTPPKEFDFLGRYTLLADIPAGINAGITEQDKSVVATYTGYTYQFNGAVLELEITEDASINKVYDIVAYIEDQNYQHHVEENNGVHHMYTTNKVDYTYNNFVLTVNDCKVQGNGTQVLPVKPTVLNGGFYRDAEDVRFDVAGQLHLARYFNVLVVKTEDSTPIEEAGIGYGDETTQTQLMFDLNLNRTGIETDANGRAEGYLVYNDGTAYDNLKMVFTEYNRQGVIVPRNASGLSIGNSTLPEVTRLALDLEVTLTKSEALALTDIDITHFPNIRVNFGQHTNSEVYDYVKAKQSTIDEIEPGIPGCMSFCLFGQLWKKTGDVYTGLAKGFYAEIETGGTIQTGTYIMPVSETFDCNIGTATFEFTEVGTYDYRGNVITGVLTLTNTSGGNVLVKLKPEVVYLPDPLPPDINVDASIVANITASDFADGTRALLYNVTQDRELDNIVVSGGNGYEFTGTIRAGESLEMGDIVKLRATRLGYLEYESNNIVSGGSMTFFGQPVIDTIYTDYGIDGSTITKFAADYIDNQIDLIIGFNFSAKELYAWWNYNLTTADGIRYFFKGVVGQDAANIMFDTDIVDLMLDNDTPDNVYQTDNIRIYRKDEIYPVDIPSTGGGGIDVVWRNRVYVAETGTSGLTQEESDKLLGLNTEDVNVTRMNSARVIGDGSEADKWRSENV